MSTQAKPLILTLDQTLLYLPAVAVIIAIPGPDMVLSLSRGLTQGRGAGFAHAFGVGRGIMAHSLLATFGVSALLTASETAFWVMKLVGGAYLIYLGVQQWRGVTSATLLNAPKAPLKVIFLARHFEQSTEPESRAVRARLRAAVRARGRWR